jgi:hypothetical protein
MLNKLDLREMMQKAIKYIVEGMAVALAAYYIPRTRMRMNEIVAIAITAAATFAVLDVLSPKIASNVRTGMGIGLGALSVGF